MKLPLALFLLAATFALVACAGTTIYDRRTGKPVARFQGDMDNSHFVGGDAPVWNVGHVSHSAATDAGGRAAGHVVKKAFDGLTEAGLAVASGGATGAVPVIATKAAAVIPIFAGSAATPTPTPTPVPKVKAH